MSSALLQALNRGKLVAAILAGSWHQRPTRLLDISECQLNEIAPLLHNSGAGALGWWRLRQTELVATESAQLLQQVYRLQTLQSVQHEKKIEKVFRLLRQSRIDAILLKGWVAGKLYPDQALRPYGDIDIYIRPQHFKPAKEALRNPEASDCWVDLHENLFELNRRNFDELFGRSSLESLGAEKIRILSPEDHLALLAIHLLKHGAWRPLWLCDVGAAIESLPKEFSWDVCLGKNKTRALWIVCAILLAHKLLDADINSLPMSHRRKQLPGWLVNNVLRQWAAPFAINQQPMSHPVAMASYLKRPRGLLEGLRKRWPNPIIATVSVNGEFNSFPRLPYQVGNCALRAAKLFFHA